MSNKIRSGRSGLLSVMILLLGLCASARAELPATTPFNPRPAEGDLVLPMPDAGQMVFRRVPVPGKGFWGSEERIIQIGDASGGIFEGLQRTQISGSFPAGADGTWEVLIGKYELTRGQYAAVMGMDALLAASADPDVQTLATLQGRSLRDAMMMPLTYVSAADIGVFIRRYNQWLFDPEHAERLQNMPKVDGTPGFVRLPAEDEWEFCARGGIEALQAGTFNDRLPFPAAKANECAWYLGNAKHKLRPVGLREADRHGIHDLFGNAQEMTAGLFRPEIWQGKPGGIAVRGGSVSTAAADLRSSLRAELDAYAWDPEKKLVEERRSYNTGARLALGSNVVVDAAQRADIEKQYDAYKAELRRSMPVGHTLDNLVSQASVQLGSADPILERLMTDNPGLKDQLAAVQVSLDKARERLELAQRQSARSLAQDAARNGVNLSVYLSRLVRLEKTLQTAKELADVSSRYQEQLAAVEKSMQDLDKAVQDQMQGYCAKVGALGEYEAAHVGFAFTDLAAKDMTGREKLVMELLKKHSGYFSEQRRVDDKAWLEDFRKAFREFSDS